MSNVALLIAIEDYTEERIPSVLFAAADLKAFSETLASLAFADCNQVCRLNAQATKTGIESDLRAVARRLTKEDTFFLFYVGHGFELDGTNYLACYDTRSDDLAQTSISLQAIVDLLSSSDCRHISVFLDASHQGLSAASSLRATPAPLDDAALEKSIVGLKHAAGFVACRSHEESHSSSHLKRGIWTHHVLEALRGDAIAAKFDARCVTSTSLQSYLSRAVPRTLRAEFAAPIVQTPWMCGDVSADFVVADLTPVLEQKLQETTPPVPRLDAVVISATKSQPVKHLPGFKKSHRLPDSKNSNSDAFIASITEATLQSDLEATFLMLKAAYRFKRLDLEKRGPADGAGVIATPFFEYAISVELDPDDVMQVVWKRSISKISDPAQVFCEEFDRVFTGVFDTIEISPDQPLDVTTVIDRIEQLDSSDFTATYDSDCTQCFVRVAGISTIIRITASGVFISDQRVESPNALLTSAMMIQQKLTNELGLKSLSAT